MECQKFSVKQLIPHGIKVQNIVLSGFQNKLIFPVLAMGSKGQIVAAIEHQVFCNDLLAVHGSHFIESLKIDNPNL